MKMLDSIKCERCGYIKHDNDDSDNIAINEVEDMKQNTDINIEYIKIQEVETIDVKLTKDLTFNIHINILLDTLMNYNITHIMFDYVRQISKLFMIMPNEC